MKSKKAKSLSVLSLMKEERGILTVGIFLAICCSALSFVPYIVIYKMIMALINDILQFQTALYLGLIAVVAAIAQNVLMSFATICTHTAAFNTMHRLKLRVLEHLSQINLGFFNSHTPGQLKSALFDDIGRLPQLPEIGNSLWNLW